MSDHSKHPESKKLFLCGIGGSGVSALALILMSKGHQVSGSDRAFDEGQTPEKFAILAKAGVVLAPQDGSGVHAGLDAVIVSSAIEDKVPDIKAAKDQGIKLLKRADVLADLFNGQKGIAVGGTSGKSTVTAMIWHILEVQGLDPTAINGAPMVNAVEKGVAGLGNTAVGKGDNLVIEADESDGTIELYVSDISVLTNVSLDHKPIAETLPLFDGFLKRARNGAVVNLDNADAASLKDAHANTLTFSLRNKDADILAQNLKVTADGMTFDIVEKASGQTVKAALKVPGTHNVENALAAVSAARLAGVPLDKAAAALPSFKGIKRRLEILGQADGVTVIDDFGHNPDKIAASLSALKQAPGRLIIVFQPHGFAPMRLMGKEIAQSFVNGMDKNDLLIMPEILYKGGTVTKDVSSKDTIDLVSNAGRKAEFIANRDDILKHVLSEAKPGDRVVIMGARDDSLTEFGHDILASLQTRSRHATLKPPHI